MRLDKHLSSKALGTRNETRELIRAGKVSVNGVVMTDPSYHISPGKDKVICAGAAVDQKTEYHLMLHKPPGVLTAARDPKQPTIMDLLPPIYRTAGCMPVGRLDKDTTGLLILTTDGQLNHRLLSPKLQVKKVYSVHVRDALTPKDIAAFARGLTLSDFTALPARLEILSSHHGHVTVHEGKYHQIKRMFHAIGNEVLQLSRIAFGDLVLDAALAPGSFRELEPAELLILKHAIEGGRQDD